MSKTGVILFVCKAVLNCSVNKIFSFVSIPINYQFFWWNVLCLWVLSSCTVLKIFTLMKTFDFIFWFLVGKKRRMSLLNNDDLQWFTCKY